MFIIIVALRVNFREIKAMRKPVVIFYRIFVLTERNVNETLVRL